MAHYSPVTSAIAALSNVLVLPSGLNDCTSPALVHPSTGSLAPTTVSYAQLATLTDFLQVDLADAGITKASRVVLVLPNGLEYVVVFLATIRQRGTAAPLDPQYTQSEFKEAFLQIKPEVVVTLPTTPKSDDGSVLVAPCVQAALELGVRVALCHRNGHGEGGAESGLRLKIKPLKIEDSSFAPAPTIIKAGLISPNDVWSEDKALMLSTSGTTGTPKSVILSHTNLLVAMRIMIANHQLSPTDRTMIITPLHHIIGICGSLLVTLFSGGCAIIPDSLPAAFWQQCIDYGITWFHAVPTLHRLLLRFPRPSGDKLSQLKFLRCGGSETPADLYESLIALGPPFLEVYGLTETGPAIFCNHLAKDGDSIRRRRGCYPIPDAVDVMILPSSTSNLEVGANGLHSEAVAGEDPVAKLTKEPDVVGEICLRGKSVMAGYMNKPEANAQTFLSNGYFRTGDLGAIQHDGYLRLMGRIKEIINKGGTKISPTDIENVALSLKSVAQAACFRIADNMYGDEIGEQHVVL